MKPRALVFASLLLTLSVCISCSKPSGESGYESAVGLRLDGFRIDIYGLPNSATAHYDSIGRLMRFQHSADPSVGGFVGSEITYNGNQILIRYVSPYPPFIASGEMKSDTVILTVGSSGHITRRIQYTQVKLVFGWDTVARRLTSDTVDYAYDTDGFLTQSTSNRYYRTWERGVAGPRTTLHSTKRIATYMYAAGMLTQANFEQVEFNQDSASTISMRTTGSSIYGYGRRYRNAFDYSSAVLASEMELSFPGFPVSKELLYLPDTETTTATSLVLPSGPPTTTTNSSRAIYRYHRNGLIETASIGSIAENHFTYRRL